MLEPGAPVSPVGVAEGDVTGGVEDGDPEADGRRANNRWLSGEGVPANEGNGDGFWPGMLSDRPLLLNAGDRSGGVGLARGVDGKGEGEGWGMTRGDRCGKRVVVRDRNDDSGGSGGTEGTKKGGSVEDGIRPNP